MLAQVKVQMPDSVRKAMFLLGVATQTRPLAGPTSASVEVSARCNFSCLMCPYHSPLARNAVRSQTDFMDVTTATRLIDGAAKLGVNTVNFGGRGEPLLNPDFAGIVRLCSNQGLQSRVFTNGTLLTRRRMEALVDAGLSTLAVSMVAATPESWVRAHPGASSETFQRIIDSLELFQEVTRHAGATAPKLALRFIIMDRSYLEMDEMVNLGIELGANSIHPVPIMYRSAVEIDSFAPSRDEEKWAVERLRDLEPKAIRAGLQINLEEMTVFHVFGPVSYGFPCYASWFEVSALVDGSVTFCVRSHQSMGNVNERPLEEIWFDSKYQMLRRQFIGSEERKKKGLDCDRCCIFYTNWSVTRRLSAFGLAPKIESGENGFDRASSPQFGAINRTAELPGQLLNDVGDAEQTANHRNGPRRGSSS